MGFPDRTFPSSGQTCFQLEMAFTDLSPENCEFVRNSYMDVFDVWSFCGCAGSSPPDICPFCEGFSDFPTESYLRTMDDEVTVTCADVSELATFVADPDYCRDNIQSFESYCCEILDKPSLTERCSVCPLGQNMTGPLRKNFVLDEILDGMTCEGMDAVLSLVPKHECSQRVGELSHGIDLAAFCGCETVQAPSLFTLCDENSTRSLGSNKDTCEEADQLAPYFSTLDMYSTELGPLVQECCQSQQACPLCSDGSLAKFPDRPLGYGRNSPTCASFALGLSNWDKNDEMCSDIRQIFGPINFESWCVSII